MISQITEPTSGFVDTFRMFMNDLLDVNRLLQTEELTNEKLALALRLAMDQFNNTPPLISQKWTECELFPDTDLLFHGGAVNAFKMAGLMHLRNQLTYSDGGIQVNTNEKEGSYRQWYMDYRAEWKERIKDIKISLNYEGAFGHVSSEYAANWLI